MPKFALVSTEHGVTRKFEGWFSDGKAAIKDAERRVKSGEFTALQVFEVVATVSKVIRPVEVTVQMEE
jgi:hypothetical protein